jgi:predicted PurR-regulated permease PerM
VVLRVVVTVLGSLLAAYLMYMLRQPLGWLVIAVFVAAAASVPVSVLNRRLPRGAAIGLVYVGIVLVLMSVTAALLAPVITQTVTLVDRLPTRCDRWAGGRGTLFAPIPTRSPELTASGNQ